MSDPARRAEILDAAEKLLSHYGERKTTVADIAREVGIGTGSVYLEFSSKEAIVCGLAERAHAAILRDLRATLTAEGPLPARVIAFFETRTALFRGACSAGQHASELLRCGGKSRSPWAVFQDEQLALLGEALGDPELARGIFLAYAAFTPPRPEVHDAEALDAVHRVVALALS